MLENVWSGFLASFPDGNNLPRNNEIKTLLLSGHLPIKRKSHLYILSSVYAAVAAQMHREKNTRLPVNTVIAVMDRRFDEFRRRYERQEWFMGRIGIDTILGDGHILKRDGDFAMFERKALYDYFLEWNQRLNKPVFIIPCDVPLVTPEAVSDFIARCRNPSVDFYFGVSVSDILSHFYEGSNGEDGIRRPYLWLREAKIRAANMIVVKPNKIGNKELIQQSFGIRKLTEWQNVLKLIWRLVKQKNRYQTVRIAVLLQAIAVLNRNGFERGAEWLRKRVRGEQLEKSFSRLFMTRFKLVVTPYGGVSLDVDCEDDYLKLVKHYHYWKRVQEEVVAREKRRPGSHIELFQSLDE